jgi:hypothetical protein
MHGDYIGARPGKFINEKFGLFNHQVDIQGDPGDFA